MKGKLWNIKWISVKWQILHKHLLNFNTVPNAAVAGSGLLLGCTMPVFFQSLLPVPYIVMMLLLIVLLAIRYRVLAYVFVVVLGCAWFTLIAQSAMRERLPASMQKQKVSLQVEVSDFAKYSARKTVFAATVVKVNQDSLLSEPQWKRLQGQKLRLNCFYCQQTFLLGEVWEFTVTLKRPHGSASWGAFDYEKYALAERIVATGSIKTSETIHRVSPARKRLARYRQNLQTMLLDMLSEDNIRSEPENVATQSRAMLLALAIGDRSLFNAETWHLLRATGLSHLVAISGLHIGLVFLLLRWFVRRLCNVISPVYCLFPALYLEVSLGFAGACCYAALAGFSLTTQRALLMLFVYCVLQFTARTTNLLSMLLLAVAALLLWDPLSTLSVSFWLSVIAVTIIAIISAGKTQQSAWKMQFFLCLAMMPFVVLLMQEVSFVAPLANFIAVPIIAFIVLPGLFMVFALLGLGQSTLADWLLNVMAEVLQHCWDFLEWLESVVPLSTSYAVVGLASVLCLFGILCIVMVRNALPAKAITVFVLLVLLLFDEREDFSQHEFMVTVLDVGQALAIAIETSQGVTVFDTGQAFNDGDSASSVIEPYLRSRGVQNLNRVIVSHHDQDHIGGLKSLLRSKPVDVLMSSRVDNIKFSGVKKPCRAGQRWKEAGVDFLMLGPEKSGFFSKLPLNNDSCVLRVSSQWGSVLLTGDIERSAEHKLVKKHSKELSVNVLIAGHHGSKTSSTPMFLAAVKPEVAVISAAYLSRHGHPHPEVVNRLTRTSQKVLNTATSGSVQIRFQQSGLQTLEFRAKHRRFWYAKR